MARYKKIVEVKKNNKGDITHVRLEGNSVFADISVAINLVKIGKIDAELIAAKGKTPEHLLLDKNIAVFGEDVQIVTKPTTTIAPIIKTTKKKVQDNKKTTPIKKKTKTK